MAEDERKERLVGTMEGIAALMGGASLEEALAVDDAVYARWAEEDERDRQAEADRAEKRRLDLVEQRLRVQARIERLRRKGVTRTDEDEQT